MPSLPHVRPVRDQASRPLTTRCTSFSWLLRLCFKTTSNAPLTFSAALFVEELLYQMQREMMAHEQLEPLTPAVAPLHVT